MKRILCLFGFHDWKSIKRKSIRWTLLEDNEQLYEVILKCIRCKKEGRIMNLILDQNEILSKLN